MSTVNHTWPVAVFVLFIEGFCSKQYSYPWFVRSKRDSWFGKLSGNRLLWNPMIKSWLKFSLRKFVDFANFILLFFDKPIWEAHHPTVQRNHPDFTKQLIGSVGAWFPEFVEFSSCLRWDPLPSSRGALGQSGTAKELIGKWMFMYIPGVWSDPHPSKQPAHIFQWLQHL